MARTTIPLSPDTRDRLKALGRKGETYDTLVNRLIDRYLGVEPTIGPGRGRTSRPGHSAPGDVDFERVR